MVSSTRATGDARTEAYSQWVTISIHNSSNKNVVIKNVGLEWGKFYRNNNKDAEVPTSEIEGQKILAGGQYRVNSCGRENASSGTEGWFEIFEEGGAKIRHFYWDCPWGSKYNTWTISDRNNSWIVDSDGANPIGGALGSITVELFTKGPRAF